MRILYENEPEMTVRPTHGIWGVDGVELPPIQPSLYRVYLILTFSTWLPVKCGQKER